MTKRRLAPLALVLPIALNGCGLTVPEKDFLADDAVVDPQGHSRQGNLEDELIAHVKCEVMKGLWRVSRAPFSRDVPWLYYRVEGGNLVDGKGNKIVKGFVRPERVNKPTPVTQRKSGKDVESAYPALMATPAKPGSTQGASTEAQRSKPNPSLNLPPDLASDPGWGTSIYLQVQVDEQTQLNPGIGVVEPMRNAYNFVGGPNTYPLTPATLAVPTISSIPQNFNIGVGFAANTHSTRLETIQFTLSNSELLADAIQLGPDGPPCDRAVTGKLGVSIDSDLKIDDFIYDHAASASFGNNVDKSFADVYTFHDGVNAGLRAAPYNVFQEAINFVASYGVGVTPTWKFARVTANPNSPTANVQRSKVNTLIITLGGLNGDKSKSPLTFFSPRELTGSAWTQHQQAAQAALIGAANKATTP